MNRSFRITSAALLISTLTMFYQGISQKPGGNVIKTEREVINTEREGLPRNCSVAKEEELSWKDIILIVLETILMVTIIALFYCCIRRYREQGFHQRHLEILWNRQEILWNRQGELESENEILWNRQGELENENEDLRNRLGELLNELDRRKAQFKQVWRNAPLYPDWRKEEFKTANVTLDAETAHPALLLSEERR